jgi:hypothetical protein
MNRRSLISMSVMTAVGFAVAAGSAAGAPAIDKRQLVGTWVLVSNTPTSPNARTFGPNDGVAIFEANGRFALSLVRSDLPKIASNNRDTGTPDENKAIVQGSIAYFGTYSVSEADGTVTLHIERSSSQTGMALIRNDLSYRSLPTSSNIPTLLRRSVEPLS